MTSQAVVIFGLRIPEELIRFQIAKLEQQFSDIGGYEDWDLQGLANTYKLSLIVVRRAYHDGDTSDRNELINNCPVYIGFSYCNSSGFNPHDLLRDITEQDLVNVNNLLLELGAPDGNYEFQFNLDTFDVDAGIVIYDPIQETPLMNDSDVFIGSELEDSGPDSP
jgi:hypothetical protein